MNKTLNTLVGTMLLATSAGAFAASSTDLTVTGVITPSACTPTLGNNGTVDYGKISVKDLNADRPTDLERQSLALTITCEAPTLMAVAAKDNRAGSSVYDQRYGLGLINGTEKLGSLILNLIVPVADGVEVEAIRSSDGGNTWVKGSAFIPNTLTSVASSNSVIPLPVESLVADLWVRPTIAPTNDLDLTNEVAIDGSVTLTVRYL